MIRFFHLPLIALLALCGCAKRVEHVEPAVAAKPFQAMPAPVWELKDVEGNVIKSERFKDKVIVVDFWATWCVPCIAEIPGYVEMQKKYAKDGLVVIGISMDEQDPSVVKQFIAKHQVDYQIVMHDDAIAQAFGGIDAIPTTFIIDRAGIVQVRKDGPETAADFEKRVLPFLK